MVVPINVKHLLAFDAHDTAGRTQRGVKSYPDVRRTLIRHILLNLDVDVSILQITHSHGGTSTCAQHYQIVLGRYLIHVERRRVCTMLKARK